MKIESIKIQLDSKIQELTLSTDDTKNLNFIIGDNGSGKTRTFNEIKSYFLNQNTGSKIEIKLTNGRVQHPDLMFVDMEELLSRNPFENKTFSDKELLQIFEKSKELLQTQDFGDIDSLQLENGQVVLKMNNGMNASLAKSEKIVFFLALLIAIRYVIEPDLPVILDSVFHNIRNNSRLKIIEMLSKNVNQILIFLTDPEFRAKFTNDFEVILPSMEEFLKEKKISGSIYFLKNNNFERDD